MRRMRWWPRVSRWAAPNLLRVLLFASSSGEKTGGEGSFCGEEGGKTRRALLGLSLFLGLSLTACHMFLEAVGHEGEPCSDNGKCRGSLRCVEGTCVNPDGGGGDGDEPDGDATDRDDPERDKDASDTSCLPGFTWDPILQDCVFDTSPDGDAADRDTADKDDDDREADDEEETGDGETSDTETCASHASSACYSEDLYWYDSCGVREEKKEECSVDGCTEGACVLYTPLPCAGGVCTDPATGLQWQEVGADNETTLADSVAYCEGLDLAGTGWRIPNISELRSLIRHCEDVEIEGACGVKDVCDPCGVPSGDKCLASSCWSQGVCSPPSCRDDGGPTGCYWPYELGGSCGLYWSGSSLLGSSTRVWRVGFDSGYVGFDETTNANRTRCVRDEPGALSCAGGVCTDPVTSFEWQETPTGGTMTWDNAVTHCTGLNLNGTGWRLPNISELRSLIRNCGPIETGGACGVKDVCASCGDATACLVSSCWTDANCNPSSCADNGGPTGCYWPQQLSGTCAGYWSSSSGEANPDYAWLVFFNGMVYSDNKFSWPADDNYVRCVR